MDDEDIECIREPSVVAQRCIVLSAVLAAGHGESRENLVTWLRGEGIWQAVSPQEAAFLQSQESERQLMINATWRAESLVALLWALQNIAVLAAPIELCDLQFGRPVLPDLFSPVAEFVATAQLRDDQVILQASEDIYQIHWAVRDAQINGKPFPEGYNPDIVHERHYALNWLIGYFAQDWDNIHTDT